LRRPAADLFAERRTLGSGCTTGRPARLFAKEISAQQLIGTTTMSLVAL
jgi:hypothetical protein